MSLIKEFRFIHKVEIERIANQIIEEMSQTRNYYPKFPLDASRVAEFLGLDVVWDFIPPDAEGEIAARILPVQRLIEINENLTQWGLGLTESTIAHEIGHWVLHINHQEIANYQKQKIVCHNQQHLKGREWQAQYFASCLLMPKTELKRVSKGKNIYKWSDLYAIAAELGVTISNLVHRLQDLGWIELASDSRQILPVN